MVNRVIVSAVAPSRIRNRKARRRLRELESILKMIIKMMALNPIHKAWRLSRCDESRRLPISRASKTIANRIRSLKILKNKRRPALWSTNALWKTWEKSSNDMRLQLVGPCFSSDSRTQWAKALLRRMWWCWAKDSVSWRWRTSTNRRLPTSGESRSVCWARWCSWLLVKDQMASNLMQRSEGSKKKSCKISKTWSRSRL